MADKEKQGRGQEGRQGPEGRQGAEGRQGREGRARPQRPREGGRRRRPPKGAEGARARSRTRPPRLRKHFDEVVRQKLTEQFGYKNRMQVPRIDKIVLNMGVGEGVNDRKKVDLGGRRPRR